MSEKLKFYSLDEIKKRKAKYNLIFGERSAGKTYAVCKEGLQKFFRDGSQIAIIRRYEEDFVGATSARTCFDALTCNGYGENEIEKMSNGLYHGIVYYGGRYFLEQLNEEGELVKTDRVVGFGFALTSQEHYKSASFPNIKTILFDEFMTRKYYLPDEFILFQNLLSTIIRHRDDVTIYMCANTVNKYGCIYFTEMGLYRVKEMKAGQIDVYSYGDSGLTVACEYTEGANKSKPSDVYFAFNDKNLRLQMITKGSWEMDIYPHKPCDFKPNEVQFKYFIKYDDELLQCEIVRHEDYYFTFIHRKTTELKDPERDLIYDREWHVGYNYSRSILKPKNETEAKVLWFFKTDKVFYQDNEVGEIVRNYLSVCENG